MEPIELPPPAPVLQEQQEPLATVHEDRVLSPTSPKKHKWPHIFGGHHKKGKKSKEEKKRLKEEQKKEKKEKKRKKKEKKSKDGVDSPDSLGSPDGTDEIICEDGKKASLHGQKRPLYDKPMSGFGLMVTSLLEIVNRLVASIKTCYPLACCKLFQQVVTSTHMKNCNRSVAFLAVLHRYDALIIVCFQSSTASLTFFLI